MDVTINDAKIDYEHASIIQMLESAQRIGAADAHADLRTILIRVKEHVIVHFVDEEFIFSRQYPMPPEYVERHKRDHAAIQNEVLRKIEEAEGAAPEQVMRMIREIRERIETHIEQIDAEMNRYLPGGDLSGTSAASSSS